jgi:hypothetical protein
MPIVIDNNVIEANDSIGLDDLVQYLNDAKIDTSDDHSMIEAGPMLKRLGNNRTFLSDLALGELKTRTKLGAGANRYGPQVIMLTTPTGRDEKFFLRANFWPSSDDHILRSSGPEQFFYHKPHDHSFNFLTVGYFGPGYSSNYYVYDYDTTAGYPGEEVDIRFVEKSALHEGKVMLYRAFVDIHDQLPPESMSVSLNVMELSVRGGALDQYMFDVENSTVSKMLNRMPLACLMPLIAGVGDEDGLDYLAETSKSHVTERVRMMALRSIAATKRNRDDCVAVFEGGTRSDSELVSGWCRHQLVRLEALAA